MTQNPTIVALEVICLGVTMAALWSEIVGGPRDPIPKALLVEGWKSLAPHYRRRVDRTIGGMWRRARVAVETWARKVARQK